MTYKQINIIKWAILAIGLILFLSSVFTDQYEKSMIFAFSTILFWIALSYAFDKWKNYAQIGNVLIGSGFIISITLFFNFGVEQTAIPKGGFIFNSDGISKSLSMLFLFLISGMLFHYLKDILPEQIEPPVDPVSEDPLIGSDWEFADPDEISSGEYELTKD